MRPFTSLQDASTNIILKMKVKKVVSLFHLTSSHASSEGNWSWGGFWLPYELRAKAIKWIQLRKMFNKDILLTREIRTKKKKRN